MNSFAGRFSSALGRRRIQGHTAARAGIRGALEKAVDVVVAEANDGESALRLTEEECPGVALLNCRLPRLEGVQVPEDRDNQP